MSVYVVWQMVDYEDAEIVCVIDGTDLRLVAELRREGYRVDECEVRTLGWQPTRWETLHRTYAFYDDDRNTRNERRVEKHVSLEVAPAMEVPCAVQWQRHEYIREAMRQGGSAAPGAWMDPASVGVLFAWGSDFAMVDQRFAEHKNEISNQGAHRQPSYRVTYDSTGTPEPGPKSGP